MIAGDAVRRLTGIATRPAPASRGRAPWRLTAIAALAGALAVAALGCDAGAAEGASGSPGPVETCQETALRFEATVAEARDGDPMLAACATGSDCTAATPLLQCERGGEPTGALESCPVAVAREQLDAFTAALGARAGEFCPTDCRATPSCVVTVTACLQGACTLLEPPPR